MLDKESELFVALQKVDKLKQELIETEKVIKEALLGKVTQNVGTLLGALIRSLIPNLVSEINYILKISKFEKRRICDDEETCQLSTPTENDVAFIKEETLDDEVQFLDDFQIIPDDPGQIEDETVESPPRRKRGRPRTKVQSTRLSKTLHLSIERLSEDELKRYSIPSGNSRPGPSSSKLKLANWLINKGRENQNENEILAKAIRPENISIAELFSNHESISSKIVSESEPKERQLRKNTQNSPISPEKSKIEKVIEIEPEDDENQESDSNSVPFESESEEEFALEAKKCQDSKIWQRSAASKQFLLQKSPEELAEMKEHNSKVASYDYMSLPGPPYLCPFCQKDFKFIYKLKLHVYSVHLKHRALECSLCSEILKHSQAMRKHVKVRHPQQFLKIYPPAPKKCYQEDHGYSDEQVANPGDAKNPFKCPVCGKPYQVRFMALAHIETHTNERKYLCPECGHACKRNLELKDHVRRWHLKPKPGVEFKCSHPSCLKNFPTSYKLRQHLLKAHQNLERKELEALFSAVGLPIKSRRGRPPNLDPLVCKICERRFASAVRLKDHMWNHNPQLLTFKCSFKGCDKAFGSRPQLKKHLNVHSDARTFSCNQCDKTFKHSSGLCDHKLRIHPKEQELLFQCGKCPEKFPSQNNLTLHLNKEHFMKKGGIICGLGKCRAEFVGEKELGLHRQRHHPQFGEGAGSENPENSEKSEEVEEEYGYQVPVQDF